MTRSGRIDTARHRRRRCAYCHYPHRFPAVCGHMFRPTSLVNRSRPPEYWQEECDTVCQPGRPSGTFKIMRASIPKPKRDIRYPYMPSDLPDSVFTTSYLSSSFHLRMLRSERTKDSMYLIISPFCPLSSRSEILSRQRLENYSDIHLRPACHA